MYLFRLDVFTFLDANLELKGLFLVVLKIFGAPVLRQVLRQSQRMWNDK